MVTRYSVRYPYEGMFPMKCVMRNQTPDMVDDTKGATFPMSVINTKPPMMDSWEENEHQEDDHMEPIRLFLKDKV